MVEKNKSILSLTNQFLIAMPGLMDPNFHRSVIYIFQHTEEGAMGVVINQPLEIKLGEVLLQMELEAKDSSIVDGAVFLGGPVQVESGFVIHRPPGDWDNTIQVSDEIGVTTSSDIILDIAKGQSPQNYLIALGYAGWVAGQLEDEMANNVWLNGPASQEILFNTPVASRWDAAAALLGVDIQHLSSDIGHA